MVTEDGGKRNTLAGSFIRDQWLRQHLRERCGGGAGCCSVAASCGETARRRRACAPARREHEFTERLPVRLFVGSYNVNGKKSEESPRDWLLAARETPAAMPDVYIVGCVRAPPPAAAAAPRACRASVGVRCSFSEMHALRGGPARAGSRRWST